MVSCRYATTRSDVLPRWSFRKSSTRRVDQSTLAVTHVVTGLRDEFALEVRQQPTCASQGRCRVVDAFVVAEQQQYRDTHRAQFVVRERRGEARSVSVGTRKCFRPRYIKSRSGRASISPGEPVIPSHRMNEFTVKRVGKNVISIPRTLNCLTIGSSPPGDRSTSL